MDKKNLLEAALFMSTRPLMLNDLGRILGVNSLGFVKDLLSQLQKDYGDRGMEIINTPQGWVMQVRSGLLPNVAHLTPYSDIPEGCKRTLALVAYKSPVKQSEIIKIQGNKAYTYIKSLVKRGLVKPEKQGHTKILKVTQEFERYFGGDSSKIKEMLQEGMENPEKKVQEDPKAETEEPKKEERAKRKGVEASHSHAFEEI